MDVKALYEALAKVLEVRKHVDIKVKIERKEEKRHDKNGRG